MNVETLRNLIKDLPDDAQVLIWLNDRNDPTDGEAVDVHNAHVSGTKDSWPDQDAALHISVLIDCEG
jgi:hypothetical protein